MAGNMTVIDWDAVTCSNAEGGMMLEARLASWV